MGRRRILKKNTPPQINTRPVSHFEFNGIPLTKTTHDFSASPELTHKRDHSINSDEPVKRPKLSEDVQKTIEDTKKE